MLPNEQFDADKWAEKLEQGDINVEFGDLIHQIQSTRLEPPKLTRGRRYAIWMRIWNESEAQPLISMSTINHLTAAWAAMVVVIMIAVSLVIPSTGFNETETADLPKPNAGVSPMETMLAVIPSIATIPIDASSLEVTQIARFETTTCVYAPVYWKNNPAAWPTDALQLGDETFTKVELMIILQDPAIGNVTYLLTQQLIAAEFNMAQTGDDADTAALMATAHQWLIENPLDSDLTAVAVQTAVKLTSELQTYNTAEPLNGEICSN